MSAFQSRPKVFMLLVGSTATVAEFILYQALQDLYGFRNVQIFTSEEVMEQVMARQKKPEFLLCVWSEERSAQIQNFFVRHMASGCTKVVAIEEKDVMSLEVVDHDNLVTYGEDFQGELLQQSLIDIMGIPDDDHRPMATFAIGH